MVCHLSMCIKCNEQYLKHTKDVPIHYLTARRPLDENNIYLIGEYKTDKSKNKFSLMAADKLSGFGITSVMPDKTVDLVATVFLTSVISIFWAP